DEGSGKKYGHLVRAVAAPNLADLKDVDFNVSAGVPVGLLYFDPANPAKIDPKFHQVRLRKGWNCIYLRHDGGDFTTGWMGFAFPATVREPEICAAKNPP